MSKKSFFNDAEAQADSFKKNGKVWFSAKAVFDVIKWAKKVQGLDKITAEQIEKRLEFLYYEPKELKRK